MLSDLFTANPANFASLIPASLMSRADLERFLKMSVSTENKDRMKDEANALVEEG